jgi:molybdopterin synthase catalytic subunit
MSDRLAFATVSADPITVATCVEAVSAAGFGAVVSFSGVVRDSDDGRVVTALSYEAHPSAPEVIVTVAELVVREFPQVRVAISHRVGSLVVGDVALACAVASAHRADAFEACARLVDEVKAAVPIWKEQFFGDGTSEWVASLG